MTIIFEVEKSVVFKTQSLSPLLYSRLSDKTEAISAHDPRANMEPFLRLERIIHVIDIHTDPIA